MIEKNLSGHKGLLVVFMFISLISPAQTVYNYTYTGAAQSVELPAGTYQLEVWGAQGGGTGANYWGVGGNGGYSKGAISISTTTTLYVYVGQQGFQSGSTAAFNGGGTGNPNVSGDGFTGGGATHIAKRSGLLSTLSSYVSDIYIVAGAGGGAGGNNSTNYGTGYDPDGGYGGGLTGGNGELSNQSSMRGSGSGGTQTDGGASGVTGDAYETPYIAAGFGIGASSNRNTEDAIQGGGGGGGYFGGGAGSHRGGAGAGGSSYIGGVTSGVTYAGNASMPNTSGGTMTGNTGYGYARITFISSVTWVGGTTGATTDWNTASNWSPAVVPTSTIDATIPATGITYYPVVASGTNAIVKNLTNNSTATNSIIVNTGGKLTVSGTYTAVSGAKIKVEGTILQ
ncbi:MAG: glycine rich domain-containing protein [Prolixibacteraceae bacterium]|nr:glycine rich domain-containing protein [Prolixibacteraceae bacterium]